MSQHKNIPKKQRIRIWDKCNGHCAYCGCELPYKDMQVNHLKSVYVHTDYREDMTEEEMYSDANLMPACRQCNFYKSTMDLDTFRDRLTSTMMENLQKNFNYRTAVKYGLIQEYIEPIQFYFEKFSERVFYEDSSNSNSASLNLTIK